MPAGVNLLLALLLVGASAPHGQAAPPVSSRQATDVSGNARVSTLSRNSASRSSTTRVKRVPIGRAVDAYEEPRKQEYHPVSAQVEPEYTSHAQRKELVERTPEPTKRHDYSRPVDRKSHYRTQQEPAPNEYRQSVVGKPVGPPVSGVASHTPPGPQPVIRRVQRVDVTGDAKASTTADNSASHTSTIKRKQLLTGRSASDSHAPSVGKATHLPPGVYVPARTSKKDGSPLAPTELPHQHPEPKPTTKEPYYPPQQPPTKEPYYPPQEPPKKAIYYPTPSAKDNIPPVVPTPGKVLQTTTATTAAAEPYYQQTSQEPATTVPEATHTVRILHPSRTVPEVQTKERKSAFYPATRKPTSYPAGERETSRPSSQEPLLIKQSSPPCYSQAPRATGDSVAQSTRTKTKIVSAQTDEGIRVDCQETLAAKTSISRKVAATGASEMADTKVKERTKGVTITQPTGAELYPDKTASKATAVLPSYPTMSATASQEEGGQQLQPILIPETAESNIRDPPSFSDVVRSADENAERVKQKLAAIESTRVVNVLPPNLNKLDSDEKAYQEQRTLKRPTRTQKLVPLPIQPETSAGKAYYEKPRQTSTGKVYYEKPHVPPQAYYPKPIPAPSSTEQPRKDKMYKVAARSEKDTYDESIKDGSGLEQRLQTAKQELDRSTFACSGAHCST